MAGNVRVKFVDVQKNRKFLLQSVQRLSAKEVRAIAKETERVIKEKIKGSLQRPNSSGNLESSFFAEHIAFGHWGVGNISFLNTNAPYWRHVNYGSQAIGANFQHRVPTGGFSASPIGPSGNAFRSGRWGVGGGNFSFISSKPIEPHLFIQRTLSEVNTIIAKVLRRGRL